MMVLNYDVTCHIYMEDRNNRAILRYLFRLIVTQMRLLTSAVAFFAAAKATDTDLAPECPVQPSCGCSAEDIEAWEGRISRWEGEMDRWEGSMREWKERQAASKFSSEFERIDLIIFSRSPNLWYFPTKHSTADRLIHITLHS